MASVVKFPGSRTATPAPDKGAVNAADDYPTWDPWTPRVVGPNRSAATARAKGLAEDVVNRKLQGKGTPMDQRGNEEMFTPEETGTEAAQTVAAGQLRAFVERVERLEEEKKALSDDIKEVYAEMKGVGFDTKAVRSIVRLRKKDQAERQEEEAILDLYKAALGMA